MSGFCGWVGFDDTDDASRKKLEVMARTMVGSSDDPIVTYVGDGVALAVPSGFGSARLGQFDGYQVAVQGRFELTDPDLATLARDRGETVALVTGYHLHGPQLPRLMKGAFALAVIAERGGDALLAIDRVGGRFPMSYRQRDGGVLFGTHGDSIQAHPVGRSDVDLQAVYNYLYFHVTPSPRSIRTGVNQMTPGSFLRIHDGKTIEGSYFRLEFLDDDRVSIEELCEEFCELVRRSVELESEGSEVGCFLSGGTDSSTVAGMLGEARNCPARSYSIGFDATGFDEMEYARVAAGHFQTDHNEKYVTPDDVLEAIPRVARAYAEPFGNASAVPTYYCARMAADTGVRRMLGGDGGDEIFAGNERYATQHVFEIYNRIPGSIRTWLLDPVVFGMPAGDRIAPVRKARSYINQARVPMPARLGSYNHLERTSVEQILDPDFLQAIDRREPLNLLDSVYGSVRAATLLNRMLALDLKFTIADNDLPKVSRMCEMAGVEVGYPFLNDDLIEFSCRVPARLKLKGLKLRWFMKHALRGYLPEKILRKRKQGFGLPFGVWLKDHAGLRNFARDSLEGLKSRGLIRPCFIDNLTHRHETEHATYYGVMIWVLMMLEQWFRAHDDPRGG